ncbi:methylenetetrahydrofolate reductase [NAD(P)H] [Nakamurella multipartita]|jgi:methylenetetrahydrofolate reductase (NADPH)|uniref:Methylenetetrahydrofolate reductase n=1 Tax=Nakamurella multipartita (strain ATCC 700099 / DSM 44233 / CIP 104796 / JCM 9543 / NBRC 105858 / Y-104) TaxID=479431 RepID=C8XCS7_NAKMY|nr:methylenetetrahydrofolate reductase [NAD(P)H] [Nakamurella multipartita]ACV79530.1 5,10-methylenetetrahydrofolate reductase [Nakamurella multipartita DSM 44233]
MPTVPERLATAGPHFSVEFMPPRSDADEDVLWRSVRRLEPLRPAFVAVTYGAGGSRRERTIRVTQRIAEETTLLPVAHLTAVGHSVAELRQIIGSYAAVGVNNILALRGDPPGDPNGEWIAHPQGFEYTGQLVALARSLGSFSVGVAAYPDKHPRSADLASDTRFLVDKINAGADFVITQMLFSAADYERLRERMERAGARVPVLPGIMPVTSHGRLMRIVELSGQRVPEQLADELYAVREDPEAGRAIGMEHAVRMSQDLLDAGAPCLHFYTFNRSKATIEVLSALGMTPAMRR